MSWCIPADHLVCDLGEINGRLSVHNPASKGQSTLYDLTVNGVAELNLKIPGGDSTQHKIQKAKVALRNHGPSPLQVRLIPYSIEDDDDPLLTHQHGRCLSTRR